MRFGMLMLLCYTFLMMLMIMVLLGGCDGMKCIFFVGKNAYLVVLEEKVRVPFFLSVSSLAGLACFEN